MHPLADVIVSAAQGIFPPPDGSVETMPAWRPGLEAAVALTGHGYLCLEDGHSIPPHLAHLARDGYGGMTDPRLVSALAGPDAGPTDIDVLDVLLVALPLATSGEIELVETEDRHHPRVAFAQRLRADVRVHRTVDATGLVVLGTGVAGLPEVSIEIDGQHRGRGMATAMLRAVRSTCDGPVVAMVSPGNAASLRAFLAAGFVPVGSARCGTAEIAPTMGRCPRRTGRQ